MFTVEHLVNMSCISNTVGGPLVGNALWTGVSLTDLLDRAAPTTDARMLMARGEDGYYDIMPLDVAHQPDVLVAFGMDDQVLTSEHGFPARLLIPGRYGFKSVKWLQELEVLTTFPLGYWEQRGWDPDGIVRTESRFDAPADHSQVRSPFIAAGIAWAGTRGVSRARYRLTTAVPGGQLNLNRLPRLPPGVAGRSPWNSWLASIPYLFVPSTVQVESRMPRIVLLIPLERVDITGS